MLCIGLYRYLDLDSDPASRTSRYVITNPPGTFDLHPTDKIFVFMPYEWFLNIIFWILLWRVLYICTCLMPCSGALLTADKHQHTDSTQDTSQLANITCNNGLDKNVYSKCSASDPWIITEKNYDVVYHVNTCHHSSSSFKHSQHYIYESDSWKDPYNCYRLMRVVLSIVLQQLQNATADVGWQVSAVLANL